MVIVLHLAILHVIVPALIRTYTKDATMIRIEITTAPDWAPTPHGSSHSDPSYARRHRHAKVTAELAPRLIRSLRQDTYSFELPRTTSDENIQIRYFESSPHDRGVPDIEITIYLASDTISEDLARRYSAGISVVIDWLLDAYCPDLAEPTVLAHLVPASSWSLYHHRGPEHELR